MAEPTSGSPIARANITTDEHGWFKAVSPDFLALIGKPVEALAGLNLIDLAHPSDAPATRLLLGECGGASLPAPIRIRLFVADETWSPMVVTVQRVADGRITLDLAAIASSVEPAGSEGSAGVVGSLAGPAGSGGSAGVVGSLAGPAGSDGSAGVVGSLVESAGSGGSAGVVGSLVESAGSEGSSTLDEGLRGEAEDVVPGGEVPGQRFEIRDQAGDESTPKIEIDADGRVAFLAGPWDALSASGATGADVLEEVIESSGHGDAVMRAVDAAIAQASSSEFALPALRAGAESEDPVTHWLQVRPIPSPHRSGVLHVLISIARSPGVEPITGLAIRPQASRERISRDSVSAPTPAMPAPSTTQVDNKADPTTAAALNDPLVPLPAAAASGDEAAALDSDASPVSAASGDAAAALDGGASPVSTASGDAAARLHSDEEILTEPAAVDAIEPASRGSRRLWSLALVSTYVAMQGLYLGPTFDTASPLNGLLESQKCLIKPLCDNNVLVFNHVAVLALIIAIVSFAVLFGTIGPSHLAARRPVEPGELSASSWRPTRRGPGLFAWASVVAMVAVTAQTLFAESVSSKLWIAAIALGAIAAWRSDRAAERNLGATMAALALALSCLLVPLGIGAVWLGERRLLGLLIVVVGLALFARSLKLIAASDSSFDTADFVAMLGFGVLAVVLGLARHHTWRYAFIGDEWSFFEGALDGRRGNARLATFDIGGPNNYFTGLTFELQASVMRVAGDNVWGWRLSSLMPMVLSVPAMYAFTRWLAGRTAAIVAAVALATGHMLLSFSMIGYNNSQSLVAVSASFAALAWAHQRPSALRFFILGSAVGSTFLVYAMARLALVPIGLLFLFLFRDNIAAFGRRLGWAALGGLATAAPALFSWENWEALLKATPVQAEDPVLQSGGVLRQVVENTLAGWLSFIGSTRNTHFIVGPHLDILSAVLLIIGLGYVISRIRHDRAMRWFLFGAMFLWTAINAVQQYAQISNTRSFMIPLVYCVFIGVGASVLLPIMIRRLNIGGGPRRVASLVAILGIALLGLNQWHIGSYANDRQQLTEQAALVQQFELTESIDGNGMQVVVGWPEERNARLNMVLRAHDIAAERIVTVPTTGMLNEEALCAKTEPTMLVMHRNHPMATQWADTMASCWGSPVIALTDPSGAIKLYRTANAAGQAEFGLDPSQRFVRDAETSDYRLADTIDIAIDGAGTAFALARTNEDAHIHRLDGGGSFRLVQRDVIDFDITNDGLFVVAANGGDDRLVWYDGRGNVVHRYGGQDEIPMIGGLSVDGDTLWASDTNKGRLLSFDATFKLAEIRTAGGTLVEPASIAAGVDGAVWAFSARSGEILLVDGNDVVTTRLSSQIFSPIDAPRLSATDAGLLIRTVREHPEVQLVSTAGELIDARGGVNGPRGAATRAGELVIADPRWHDVPVLAVDERWAPAPRGTIAWNARSLASNDRAVYDSPFISDELYSSGPIAVDLIETAEQQTADGQTYRAIGVPLIGEVQGIAAVGEGAYVVDVIGRLVRLDATGAAVNVIGVAATGATYVTDVAVDQANVAWVLDAGEGRVVRVDDSGTGVPLPVDAGPLRNARGIGAGLNDTAWVASTAAAQLTQIGADGSTVSTVPLPGRQPSDVVQLDDSTLWVVDSQELELVHLTVAGEVLVTIPLGAFTSVDSPHLAIAGDKLWVSDPEASAVFVVDVASGEITEERIDLVRPDGSIVRKAIGITVGPDGRVWTTDSTAGAIIIVG